MWGSLADRAGEARERGRESFFEAQEGLHERRSAHREGRRPPSAPESEAAHANPVAPRPKLRDVSTGVEAGETEDPVGEAERSEELRRKVRETRERLRGRRDLGQGPEE